MRDRSPARGLLALAEQEHADLIAVGSTHRGTIGRVLPGSVTERLLRGSPVPVAVAPLGFADRDEEQGIRVIGVAYDGTLQAEAALAAAVELALEAGAALRLVAVAEDAPMAAAPAGFGAPPLPRDAAKAHLDALMAETLASIAPEARAAGKVLKGDPATVIAGEAEAGMDLLFCGSRGYGPVRTVLLGGVSTKLMRLSPCPVIVLPRPAPADGGEPTEAVASGERGGTT